MAVYPEGGKHGRHQHQDCINIMSNTPLTLTGGSTQGASNVIVPLGSITFVLSADASTDAGLVMAGIPVTFHFDSSGNLSGTCHLWSNANLTPSGTFYTVCFYDQYGSRVSQAPLQWRFTQASGSTVDIGTMNNTAI
jgi:hypothetical protein